MYLLHSCTDYVSSQWLPFMLVLICKLNLPYARGRELFGQFIRLKQLAGTDITIVGPQLRTFRCSHLCSQFLQVKYSWNDAKYKNMQSYLLHSSCFHRHTIGDFTDTSSRLIQSSLICVMHFPMIMLPFTGRDEVFLVCFLALYALPDCQRYFARAKLQTNSLVRIVGL